MGVFGWIGRHCEPKWLQGLAWSVPEVPIWWPETAAGEQTRWAPDGPDTSGAPGTPGAVSLSAGRPGRAGRALVEECAAFLSGRYVEHLGAHAPGASVPRWAWTNLLAHGSVAALAAAAHEPPQDLGTAAAWRAARSYLATEILRRCADAEALAGLQRRVLQPLEAALAGRPCTQLADPCSWVRQVGAALGADRAAAPARPHAR